jgi:hypothetical protein
MFFFQFALMTNSNTNGKFIQTAHSLQEDNLNDDNPIVTELIFRACAVGAGKKQER